jgi:hypothetical protein
MLCAVATNLFIAILGGNASCLFPHLHIRERDDESTTIVQLLKSSPAC